MSMKLLAALGGLATGWNEATRDEQKRAQQEEDRQYMLEKREQERTDAARKEEEYQRAMNIRSGLEEAGKTPGVEVVDPPVSGDQLESGPLRTQFKVGGKTFDDEASAKQAASDPADALRRQASFLASRGLSADAAKLYTQADGIQDATVKRGEAEKIRKNDAENMATFNHLFKPGSDPFEQSLSLARNVDPNADIQMTRGNGRVVITKDGKPMKSYTDDRAGQLNLLYDWYKVNNAGDFEKRQQAIQRLETEQRNRERQQQIDADKSALLAAQTSAAYARVGGAGVGGARAPRPTAAEVKAAAAAVAPLQDKVSSAIHENYKHLSQDAKGAALMSDLVSTGNRIAQDTSRYSGGSQDPNFLASVAHKLQTGQLEKTELIYNPHTGGFNRIYADELGPNGTQRKAIVASNLNPDNELRKIPDPESRSNFVKGAIDMVSPVINPEQPVIFMRKGDQVDVVPADSNEAKSAQADIAALIRNAAVSGKQTSPYYRALEDYVKEQAGMESSVLAKAKYGDRLKGMTIQQAEQIQREMAPIAARRAEQMMNRYKLLIDLGDKYLTYRSKPDGSSKSGSSGLIDYYGEALSNSATWGF